MPNTRKIFVVVDPTDDVPVALERAITTARFHSDPTKLKVFIAVDPAATDTRAVNDRLFRENNWFEETIYEPLAATGIDHVVEMSWSRDWQQAILRSSKFFGADRIYLPVHERSDLSRFTFSDAKWGLLEMATCPVVLVQPQASKKRSTVLAAVNFQGTQAFQQQLNSRIIEWGREVASHYQADFHVVNTYLDATSYPDREQLAMHADVAEANLHIMPGATGEAVNMVAQGIGADLVVMGTSGNTAGVASRRGHTAARVIEALTQDVMVVNG